MRLINCIFILLLAGNIASCGLVKTVYNSAPEAVSWWLDDYFDFNQSQKTVLNPALHALHDWHRANQLPIYVALLKELQSLIAKPQTSPTAVCDQIDAIKVSLTDLQMAFIPVIVEIAPSITLEQVRYLDTKLEKRAEKWKSEWWQETLAEQITERLDKMEDYAEKVYGDLSMSQRLSLKQSLSASTIQPALTYAEILRRNADLKQIVIELRNPLLNTDNKKQLVKQGFERLQHSPNTQYQAYADETKKRTCEIIAELHASTNAKQKQHAHKWLENYIVQFSSLSVAK